MLDYTMYRGNEKTKMHMKVKATAKRKRVSRKALGTRRRTRFNRVRRIVRSRARVHRNRTIKKIKKITAVPQPLLPVVFILKDMSVERLTPDEINKCNALLRGCFTGDIDMSQLEINNTCVLGMLGDELVTFMCIRQSPLETTDSNDSKLIHTVCTSEQYRGRGLLKQMFHWVASTPKYRNAFFRLEAANTVEPDKGLNQTTRFKIYSKTGFVLKIGTQFHPCKDMVENVTIKPELAEITYLLRNSSGNERWITPDKMEGIDACYTNSQHHSNGCWMESTAPIMREFNKPKSMM